MISAGQGWVGVASPLAIGHYGAIFVSCHSGWGRGGAVGQGLVGGRFGGTTCC